jgi:hypothetical protein
MELQFADATAAMHKDVRRNVMACMETGNFDQARIVLDEYTDEWPTQAAALKLDLIAAYGTNL